MAEFLDERLPLDLRMGAVYRDEFSVEIIRTQGGSEHRRLRNPFMVRHYTAQFTTDQSDLWARVMNLYFRAYGTLSGFRVKCLDDFTTHLDNISAPSMLDHPMQYISSGLYQLQKRYGLGASSLSIGYPVRTIFKPVVGSVVVAKNGVAVSSGVSVNLATGRVTITPAPLIGDAMTAGCEFDIPCRFNSAIDVQHISNIMRDATSIEIIELLAP